MMKDRNGDPAFYLFRGGLLEMGFSNEIPQIEVRHPDTEYVTPGGRYGYLIRPGATVYRIGDTEFTFKEVEPEIENVTEIETEFGVGVDVDTETKPELESQTRTDDGIEVETPTF